MYAAEIALLTVLVRAAPQARDALTAHECDLILDLCTGAARMAPDLPGDHPGRAARAGAELLLAETLPHLDEDLRKQLARAVEVMVVRRSAV